MKITLSPDDVQLLAAVEQGLVHSDPRFRAPDFERDPATPHTHKRATQRLRPLKQTHLVELVDASEADKYGVRLYRLTVRGKEVLAQARAAEAEGPDR